MALVASPSSPSPAGAKLPVASAAPTYVRPLVTVAAAPAAEAFLAEEEGGLVGLQWRRQVAVAKARFAQCSWWTGLVARGGGLAPEWEMPGIGEADTGIPEPFLKEERTAESYPRVIDAKKSPVHGLPFVISYPRILAKEEENHGSNHMVFAVYFSRQARDLLEAGHTGAITTVFDVTGAEMGRRTVGAGIPLTTITAEMRAKHHRPMGPLPGVFRLDITSKRNLDEHWSRFQGRGCQSHLELSDGAGTVFSEAEVLEVAVAPPAKQ